MVNFKNSACHGLTLIELLSVIAVIGILSTQLNVISLRQSRIRHDIDNGIQELVSGLSLARAAAVAENTLVTFCRSDNGADCQGKWEQGSIIFTDANADHVVNGNDRLLFRLPPFPAAGKLTFNSFQNKQYLQLTARGSTSFQNGNFTFCPSDGDLTLARQLIVNLTGRVRHARDSNGDGIVENAQGKPLSC